MALVALNQQTTFADPQNGQSPMDADTVRSNDNALVAKHNAHDADVTIHVQTGLLASRPTAATPYAMYLDENSRLYVDSGAAWTEVPYARLDAAGVNAFLNNVTIGGTLGVTGTTAVTGNATVGGNLTVTGTVTAGGISGPTVVPASSVTTGTFAAGNFVFPAALTVTTTLAAGATTVTGAMAASGAVTGASVVSTNGPVRGARQTTSGSGATLDFATGNHHRVTMTGNGTLTLSSGSAGGVYTVEVLQDGTGSRTVAWGTGVGSVLWPSGASAPTVTATANRKDIFTFYFDGTNYLGQTYGQNYASTG
jgi:hypothetical protein